MFAVVPGVEAFFDTEHTVLADPWMKWNRNNVEHKLKCHKQLTLKAVSSSVPQASINSSIHPAILTSQANLSQDFHCWPSKGASKLPRNAQETGIQIRTASVFYTIREASTFPLGDQSLASSKLLWWTGWTGTSDWVWAAYSVATCLPQTIIIHWKDTGFTVYYFNTFDKSAKAISYFCPTSLQIMEYINNKLAVPTLVGEKCGAKYTPKFGSFKIIWSKRGISYSTPHTWDWNN